MPIPLRLPFQEVPRRWLIFLWVGLLFSQWPGHGYGQETHDFAIFKSHFREFYLQVPQKDSEQLAVAQVADDQIRKWAATLEADGSWPDVNYVDQTRGGWQASQHLSRMLSMAEAYGRNKVLGKNDPALLRAALSAFDYWTRKDFHNPNWWHNVIGVPEAISTFMLLMEDELSPEEKAAGFKIITRTTIGRTGENLVWQAGIVFKTAALQGDAHLAQTARDAILSCLVVTTEEGIQTDESFHQHGSQQQFGNYGLAFFNGMSEWAWMWRGTAFAVSDDKVAILRDYTLHGESVVVTNKTMDISACGRQLFPNAPAGKAKTLLSRLGLMAEIDPSHGGEYQAAIQQDSSAHGAGNTLNDNFYRSDYMVQRRPDYYASVKMCSKRVIGGELVNGENISGRYLADGAMYLYQTGMEYTDIFPVWDWRRLPGVTCEASGNSLQPAGIMETDFAGGVSDGTYGVAGLDYNRDGVTAKKGWFFFDHEIVCLGAGINSKTTTPLVTSIEQSLLAGNIFAAHGTSPGKKQALEEHPLDHATWAWHNERGYFFPEPQTVTLRGVTQTGEWTKIYPSTNHGPVSKQVFSLWIDHGKNPINASYTYVVLPAQTADQTAAYAAHPQVTIVSNTPFLQAVKNKELNLTLALFFHPGKIETKVGTLAVDKPCALMIHEEGTKSSLMLSDPTQLSTVIHITLDGQNIAVALPQGAAAGSTVPVPVP